MACGKEGLTQAGASRLFSMIIISGGQTGADQAGLIVAKEFGIETSGFAAKNFMTEKGPNLKLKYEFNLIDSGLNYHDRTILNCQCSDITYIFTFNENSPGTKVVKQNCANFRIFDLNQLLHAENNPIKFNFTLDLMSDCLNWEFDVINIAGNRESFKIGNVERLTKHLIRHSLSRRQK